MPASASRAAACFAAGDVDGLARWAETVYDASHAGSAYDGFTSPRAAGSYLRAIHRWLVGDLGAAIASAETALGPERVGAPWDLLCIQLVGIGRYWSGDAEGRSDIERALARARELRFDPPVVSGLSQLALVHALDGDLEEARRLAMQAIELAERTGVRESATSAVAHTALGQVLLAEERPDEALPSLERGLELARRGSGALGLVEALIALAGAAGADERRPLLSEARRILEGCSDPGRVAWRRLEAAERRAGAVPRPVPALGEPFSERELQVRRMLAGTLSQREIGSELFISLNTVKSHAKAIYRKLGAEDRTGAVARARELGLL
jgi:LuxR family maltose regulon positive regulatory protein